MPIQIANGKTIEQCIVEETEDYILYCDGEVATIENYMTGTYDIYLERKADMESGNAVELLALHKTEWTIQDDIQMLQSINLEQLNKPVLLQVDENSVTLETRNIPIPINFCCRIDKKTGEIYKGDGYENLAQEQNCQTPSHATTYKRDINGNITISTLGSTDTKINGRYGYKTSLLTPSTKYTASLELIKSYDGKDVGLVTLSNSFPQPYNILVKVGERISATATSSVTPEGSINQYVASVGDNVFTVKYQITKTSTPKPFVRSVMPSGKLSFITSATSETHSFIGKGFVFSCPISQSVIRSFYSCESGVNVSTSEFVSFRDNQGVSEIKRINYIISSSVLKVVTDDEVFAATIERKGVTKSILKLASYWRKEVNSDSFRQLLIYKGNLNEQELKAELAKDIKLATNNAQMHIEV